MTSLCDIAYSDLCDFFYLQTTKKDEECHYKTSHEVKCPREKMSK